MNHKCRGAKLWETTAVQQSQKGLLKFNSAKPEIALKEPKLGRRQKSAGRRCSLNVVANLVCQTNPSGVSTVAVAEDSLNTGSGAEELYVILLSLLLSLLWLYQHETAICRIINMGIPNSAHKSMPQKRFHKHLSFKYGVSMMQNHTPVICQVELQH